MIGFQISVAHLIASGLSDPLQGSQILRELAKRVDSSAHIQVHVNEFANRVHPSSDHEFNPTINHSPGLRSQRVSSRGQVSVRPATALRVSRVAQLLRAETAAAEVGQALHLEVAEMRVPGIRWETQARFK